MTSSVLSLLIFQHIIHSIAQWTWTKTWTLSALSWQAGLEKKRFFFRKWVEEWTIILQETRSNQLTKLTITGFLFIPYKRILLNSFTFITFSIFQHLHEAKNALTAMLMQEKRGFQLRMHTMLAVRILVVWHTENCAKKKKQSYDTKRQYLLQD